MGFSTLSPTDIFVFLWFIAVWFGYAAFAEYQRRRTTNIFGEMDKFRLQWMQQMLKRDNRMVDSTIMGNLLRSIAFFASTSIFLLLGLGSLLGYRDRAMDVLSAIPFAWPTSPLLWEGKILLLIIIFIYSFFKFTWSLRQYNYASIMVGAAPLPGEDKATHNEYAARAASLITNAARHFNLAFRGYYFGLAALSWFLHPWLFAAASTWVAIVLYRREFKSRALRFISLPTASSN